MKENISGSAFIKYLADNHVKITLPESNRKYPLQQCQNEHLNRKFRGLHTFLVNQIIDFCKAHNILIDEFHLSADCLEESIKAGTWQSCTDSCLRFDKFTQEYKDCIGMKDEESIRKFSDEKEYRRICSEQEPFLISL